MAQKVNIVLVDDIDGAEATETISFGFSTAPPMKSTSATNSGPFCVRRSPPTSVTAARSAVLLDVVAAPRSLRRSGAAR